MAVFTSSAMALRRKLIVNGLRKSGAVSPETAKTLAEAGVELPDAFPEYTEKLAFYEIINRTEDGRYWIGDSE